MRCLIRVLLLQFLVVAGLHAQNDTCPDLTNVGECTVIDLLDRLDQPSVTDAQLDVARVSLGLEVSRTVMATPLANIVENELRVANVAATPPATSGAQVHAGRHNFNIPAALAIDSIEREKQALVVQFNKINAGPFGVGVTGTVKQPAVFGALAKKIPEAQRAAVTKNLEGMLEDTDDLSLALLFTPATPDCTGSRLDRGACYGREAAAYREVLSNVFASLLEPTLSSLTSGIIADRFSREFGAVLEKKVKEISVDDQKRLFDAIVLFRFHRELDTLRENKARKQFRFDENLAKLIGNQPQWTLALVGKRRDVLSGPNEQGLELVYERGRVNLNALHARCKRDTKCIAETISDKFASDSFKFTLGATQTEHYELAALPAGASEETVEFTALDLPRVRKYLAAMQYGFDVGNAGFTEDPIRFDMSAKWEQRSGNPEEEFDTRFVAAATLSIPIGEQVTLPLTLSYANHEDLLENQQKSLGVHFGLTYRLPFKKPE